MNLQAARSKFDLHDKDFMAWMSLIKPMPVNWKRGIEDTEEDTGLAHYGNYGNALPIMTVKNVYRRMLQPPIKQPTS